MCNLRTAYFWIFNKRRLVLTKLAKNISNCAPIITLIYVITGWYFSESLFYFNYFFDVFLDDEDFFLIDSFIKNCKTFLLSTNRVSHIKEFLSDLKFLRSYEKTEILVNNFEFWHILSNCPIIPSQYHVCFLQVYA